MDEKVRGKLSTRSTRFTCFCTAQASIFQQKIVEISADFSQKFQNWFCHFSAQQALCGNTCGLTTNFGQNVSEIFREFENLKQPPFFKFSNSQGIWKFGRDWEFKNLNQITGIGNWNSSKFELRCQVQREVPGHTEKHPIEGPKVGRAQSMEDE